MNSARESVSTGQGMFMPSAQANVAVHEALSSGPSPVLEFLLSKQPGLRVTATPTAECDSEGSAVGGLPGHHL
jgi:hypothetical protein